MLVSEWLGHESYVTTLNIYADYISEQEGGKSTQLARSAPPSGTTGNVLPFRRRADE
jgi:hypothetical protein